MFSNMNIKSEKWNKQLWEGIIRSASDRELMVQKTVVNTCFFKPDGPATALRRRIDGVEKTDVLKFVVTCIRCLLANWVLTQFKLQLVNGTNIFIRFTDTEGPGVFTRTHMWFTENPTSTKSLLLQSPNLPDIFHKKFLQFTQWNILSVSVWVLRKFQLLNQLLRMHMHMTTHKDLVQIRS